MEKEQFIKDILPLRQVLLSHSFRIMNNAEDAEDIVQEAFIKLWSIRDTLGEYNNVAGLSMQITKHLCINKIRSRQCIERNEQNSPVPTEVLTPHRELENKDNLNRVMEIIKQLPDTQQSILIMKHVDGLEVNEIAELIGSNPNAVITNLSRARKRVKELFFKLNGHE